jgi:hypothetical protein
MQWLDLIQWPAMVITVMAAWLTGSQRRNRRMIGFWCFLASNLLWGLWGWYQQAWAMIVLQICLAAMNVRGVNKNEK